MHPNAVDALIFWFPAYLFSTSVHEAAHAWAALRGGDATAYHGGQVSLSPLPHVRREPVGMVVVPIVTALLNGWCMGWASAPYDPEWARRHPRRAAAMAAAGPLANLALALIAFIALRAGLATGWFTAPEALTMSRLVEASASSPLGAMDFMARLLSVGLSLNVLLAAFNLIPLPPLDGASVVAVVLPRDVRGAFQALASQPMFTLLGIFVAWRVFPMISTPTLRWVVACLYPGSLRSG